MNRTTAGTRMLWVRALETLKKTDGESSYVLKTEDVSEKGDWLRAANS